ncbi:HAD-IA family hydrolase [Sulfitobacter sp. S190]|uniref:HAD-IA family hydrolase n=1 Tax=Sulfitobacter sp. S190 TaxID=2867022 RepID=UPI0021A8F1CC|nr:HAD-IA family hydrolase [Sulfitobacter sp. S190]UWR21986.1 HAD-IA family hydrolase [Sulfitobacter sp. S190]
MKAIFFGSLSVLADTSEMQREAFNDAFKDADLDWSWDAEMYRDLLEKSGGRARITEYARTKGVRVDSAALHARKSELFQKRLRQGGIEVRPLTRELMAYARVENLQTAFVSTTSKANIDALFEGLGGREALGLSLVTSGDDAVASKPNPEIYKLALGRLDLMAADVIAVEDNVEGVQAAENAAIRCLAYPNANTQHNDFGDTPMAEDWLRRRAAA